LVNSFWSGEEQEGNNPVGRRIKKRRKEAGPQHSMRRVEVQSHAAPNRTSMIIQLNPTGKRLKDGNRGGALAGKVEGK